MGFHFLSISEWINENIDSITEYDPISKEITWNDNNLGILFKSIDLLMKK